MIHADPIKVKDQEKNRVFSLTRKLWFSLSTRSQVNLRCSIGRIIHRSKNEQNEIYTVCQVSKSPSLLFSDLRQHIEQVGAELIEPCIQY